MSNPSEEPSATCKRMQALLEIPPSKLDEPLTWKEFLPILEVLLPNPQQQKERMEKNREILLSLGLELAKQEPSDKEE